MISCNIMSSVSGFFDPPWSDGDKVIIGGGFLDNCYLGVPFGEPDTSLGLPIDTIGDGICTTISQTEYLPRFYLVDGVYNPRSDTIWEEPDTIDRIGITSPFTTSKYLLLKNNYPNPFTKQTTIEFEITKTQKPISLKIYNSQGQQVNNLIDNLNYSPGDYSIEWDGTGQNGNQLPPGIYYYVLRSKDFVLSKQCILIQ